jgi:hypothetical protein
MSAMYVHLTLLAIAISVMPLVKQRCFLRQKQRQNYTWLTIVQNPKMETLNHVVHIAATVAMVGT